ncbi:MAG TPA: CbiX/SirB N-terminal domain-containing protein [Afifellaceae bacterium]|nr:CbiX/SirB N-terminal domain-containing protein [Afifellaceae bacterium]
MRPELAIEPGSKKPALLIAAHGDLGGSAHNAALRALVEAVRARLPDMPVVCGVLNGEPAVEAACAELAGHRIVVYPLFMSGGYYVETVLPERLGLATAGNAGSRDVTILPPLGLDPALSALVARRVRDTMPANPYSAAGTSVLVIAHGSASGHPQPRLATEAFADGLRQCLKTQSVSTAYLEEPPFAEDAVAALSPRSVVVSLFVGKGSHGGADVADILAKAGKSYVPVIGPVGADRQIADLVIAALRHELTGERKVA